MFFLWMTTYVGLQQLNVSFVQRWNKTMLADIIPIENDNPVPNNKQSQFYRQYVAPPNR